LEELGGGFALAAFLLEATDGSGDAVTFGDDEPATIDAAFTGDALNLVEGDRERLALLRFDAATGKWEQADCGPLDGTSDVVQCRATHLSPWVVVALEHAAGTFTPPDDGTSTPAPTRTATPTATPTKTATPPPQPPTIKSIACAPNPALLHAQVTCIADIDGPVTAYLWGANPGEPSSGSAATFVTTFPTGIAGKGQISLSACNGSACAQAAGEINLIFVEAPPPPTPTTGATPVLGDPPVLIIDTDGDGIPDSSDICPNDPTNTCLIIIDPIPLPTIDIGDIFF
jgi:hypothetical protein